MPIGIMTNVAATAVGGLLGCAISTRLPEPWKKQLNNLLGISAIVVGIVTIIKVQNLSAVVLSLLLGACVGQLLCLEERINTISKKLTTKLMGGVDADDEFLAQISTALIILCFSGARWYGALNEGLTGDGSMLITKAILDGITACIFATLLGKCIPCLCLPQMIVYMVLFNVSGFIRPYITPVMISDFSALGGIVTLVAGLRLSGIKQDAPGLNLLPGLILVFYISAIWTSMIG